MQDDLKRKKEQLERICGRYEQSKSEEESALFSFYSHLLECVIILLSGKNALTEARNKVRLVRTELLPVKDRLAKYDLEHLNEEVRVVEKMISQQSASSRPVFSMNKPSPLGMTRPLLSGQSRIGAPLSSLSTKNAPQKGMGKEEYSHQSATEAKEDAPSREQYTLDGVENQNILLKSEEDVIHLHAVKNSVVVIMDEKKSIHLSDIDHSLIFINRIHGSILSHRITNSILVVTCLQCRIHDSSSSLFSLFIPNHPVIENCQHLVFSDLLRDRFPFPFPTDLSNSHQTTTNMCFEVKDFNWFQRDPSPHWREGTFESYANVYDYASALMKQLYDMLGKEK